MRTLTHRVAEAAFRIVEARQRESRVKDFKRYAAFAKSFPILIHQTGLSQAWAFATARDSKGRHVDEVRSWVAGDAAAAAAALRPPSPERASQPRSATDEDPNQLSVTDYLAQTRRLLLAATWVKRYVEALEAGETAAKETGR